ncbi:helix-turn-helix domain-containing protein [Tengunoibacter tsumagoiensis]|uniref:HTH cro/C1-type domain-containing protein n=1 Tax=Tengunoibacter tsumagoiensis TaxID=2014871 RepID=A0A401ZUU8_9CHLR|nr:helix-turn-helix transcriptional regulator [Tengunoibacter tsumagoiensis]GCE10494.1 hypothetical protein KTT_03530 [Tengunoibacter tsumagoiensis]
MEKQNNLLKSARMKKRWTLEFASGQVGVSRSTYIRWEAGAQIPRLSSLTALCHTFEMSPEELGFSQSFDRKKSPPLLNEKPLEEEVSEEEQLANLPEALVIWDMGLTSCWQWYMAGGQTELERLMPTYLSRLARPTLYPGPDQRTAASLTSQVYQLIALLDLQRGDYVSAQTNGTQALVYSQLAKDWNMYVAAQIRLAIIFSARKRIGSALIAYNDALRRINADNNHVSPMLHSWIFAGLAEIQATMGRDTEAMQFIKLAFAVFPEHPEDDPCITYAQCDRSMLYLYQGQVFLRLGQPRLAWEAFSQIDDFKPSPPARVRAEFLKHRTYTSLVLGNMIQTCIYLEAAARAAQEIHSDLAFSEVYTLYEHMLAIWGGEVRVRNLARLFQR